MNVHTTGLALAALMATQQQTPITTRPATPADQHNPIFALDRLIKLEDLVSRPVNILAKGQSRVDGLQNGKQADPVTVNIANLLIESSTSKIDWAVVSVGGFLGMGAKHVLVPYASMEWRPETNDFALYATKDQLKLLPDFDASKAVKDGMDDAVQVSAAGATAAGFTAPAHSPRPAQQDARDAAFGATVNSGSKAAGDSSFPAVPEDYVLFSHLRSVDVYTLEEEAGKVEFLAVDPLTGSLPFSVIGFGGVLGVGRRQVIVPSNLLSLHHRLEDLDDDQGFWCIPFSKAVVTNAPSYVKPENGIVEQVNLEATKQFFKDSTRTGASL